MPRADTRVYIYESEYKMINAAAREFANIETGGDLYGSFTHGGMPVIWLASGPGPRVSRTTTHFEQDTAFTTDWQRKLLESFGIQYIGSWHSHHTLALREPSAGDREAARKYALNHGREKTLEIIVTHERNGITMLWPYFYPNAAKESWSRANFIFLPAISPIRIQLDLAQERFFSGGTNWKKGMSPNALDAQRSTTETSANEEVVDIPDELAEELASLGDHLEDVTPTGKTVVIRIAAKQRYALDVFIDMASRIVTRINLIDKEQNNKKYDVTEIVQKYSFSLFIRSQSRVLYNLLQSLPAIQSQVETFKKVTAESRASDAGSTIPESGPDDRQPSPKEARPTQSTVFVGKNPSGGYEMRFKIGDEQSSSLLREVLHKLKVKVRQEPIPYTEQVLFIETLEDLQSTMEEFNRAFKGLGYKFGEEVEQDINQFSMQEEEKGRKITLWSFLPGRRK